MDETGSAIGVVQRSYMRYQVQHGWQEWASVMKCICADGGSIPRSRRRSCSFAIDDSHISANFVAHCIEHEICLFLLPPHSSHLLRPLNVSVFGPLKTAGSADRDRLIRVGVNRLEKVKWVESYVRVRQKAFTEKNIHSGWRHSGLVPTNRNRHHQIGDFPS